MNRQIEEIEKKVNVLLGKTNRMAKQLDHIENMLCYLVNKSNENIVGIKYKEQPLPKPPLKNKIKNEKYTTPSLFDPVNFDINTGF